MPTDLDLLQATNGFPLPNRGRQRGVPLSMYRGFDRFFRLAYKSCFRSRGTFARLTPKRFFIMSAAIPVLFLVQLMHRVGFWLDDLLFPGYRDVEVKAPVFIVGIPRSGTTLLQRVLAEDTANFTGFKLWESMLAPSIVEWKFWTLVGRADKFLGGLGYRLLSIIERRWFRELSKIHPTSLFDHEEDEPLFFTIFASAILIYPFPFPEDVQYLARFDEEVSGEEQAYIMAFYKSCIQRHLYVHGASKHYMTKNTISTSKVEAIRRVFPDAGIICNVRSPYNSIPSIMSLADFYWRQFDDGGTPIEFRDRFMDIARHLYTHPMETLPAWPEAQHAFVRYDDLKNDLSKAVAGLYARLGLALGADFARRLEEQNRKAKGFKSKHVYSMEDWLLSPELILEYYHGVFDYFDFPKEHEAQDSGCAEREPQPEGVLV